ncbi:MAG: 4-(cytidine 5'-diphospho)-2-C-methyl-D-erythritol kinase [Clostridia bacterium]|nr:4-(cytidine 5'-diphospho)-2-C-methyl-D-erythritol kinase [Clostridia bacterium]
MADRLAVRACAKINLFLDITARREDGYHLLNSVMQQISLADVLDITMSGKGDEIHLTSDHGALACDESNLIWRAANAFWNELGERRNLSVHLKKNIPMAAGMGGGSADCAAMLRALNRLCGDPFSRERLCEIGATLGADVPFCVLGSTARAEGIGEKLTPLHPMPHAYLVVAMGPEQMPTPAAYRALDLRYDNFSERLPCVEEYNALISAIDSNVRALAACMYNIFENAVFPALPVLAERVDFMLQHGACGARMSGSGAAVFGVFDEKSAAESAAATLRNDSVRTWICTPEQMADN